VPFVPLRTRLLCAGDDEDLVSVKHAGLERIEQKLAQCVEAGRIGGKNHGEK